VYVGRWLAPARTFVDEHAEELVARPTWLFSSGPIGDPAKPAPEEAVKLDEILERTSAQAHRVFGGKVDRRHLGFAERAIVRAVRAREGDYRDWGAIRGYAEEIAESLNG
jgi:menaquinone-dependent protoporphyrinogen oxidase